MRTDPISLACSLDDQELAERRTKWRSVAEGSLIESFPRPDGFTARYRGDAETARALEALIAAERECCPEIEWRLVKEPDAIRLEVRHPVPG